MKSMLSIESANRRRRLVSLLRELRSIRREPLGGEQLLGKARATLDAAGEAGGYIQIALRSAPGAEAPCHLSVAVDRSLLREVEGRELLQPAYVCRPASLRSEACHG